MGERVYRSLLSLHWRYLGVVSFTPRPLNPRWKGPWYQLHRRLSGPQSRFGHYKGMKILEATGTRTHAPSVAQQNYLWCKLWPLKLNLGSEIISELKGLRKLPCYLVRLQNVAFRLTFTINGPLPSTVTCTAYLSVRGTERCLCYRHLLVVTLFISVVVVAASRSVLTFDFMVRSLQGNSNVIYATETSWRKKIKHFEF
jgi:hypothetical protein